MEKKPPRSLLPFDEQTMPPNLYIMKLFLPFVPASFQKFLAIYIKCLELSFTLRTFQGFSQKELSLTSILDLFPYLGADQGFSLDPSDLFGNMFTKEQQQEFEMYSQMFDEALSPNFKNE